MLTTFCRAYADISLFLLAKVNLISTILSLGSTPNIKGSRQAELPMVHVTSQQSNLDAPEWCADDVLDCLASFYGGVS